MFLCFVSFKQEMWFLNGLNKSKQRKIKLGKGMRLLGKGQTKQIWEKWYSSRKLNGKEWEQMKNQVVPLHTFPTEGPDTRQRFVAAIIQLILVYTFSLEVCFTQLSLTHDQGSWACHSVNSSLMQGWNWLERQSIQPTNISLNPAWKKPWYFHSGNSSEHRRLLPIEC